MCGYIYIGGESPLIIAFAWEEQREEVEAHVLSAITCVTTCAKAYIHMSTLKNS